MSAALPGIEMRCPRLHQVGETDGQISCCNNEIGSHTRQSGLLHHSEQQAQVGVTELRAEETGYRKEGIGIKILPLREQRDKKNQTTHNQKKNQSFVFVLSSGKELQCLLVL